MASGAAERAAATGIAPNEIRRRTLHVAAGVLGPLAALLGPGIATPAFVALVAVAGAAELARFRWPGFGARLERLAGGAFRPGESRGVTGASLLAAGFAVSWWLFPAAGAERAILVAALADPMAAAVGTRFGGGTGKSWVGSTACAVTAALVLLLTGVGAAPAAVAAIVAAATERAPWRGADNVAIPLGVGAVLWWLG
jgi:dolichol kinase